MIYKMHVDEFDGTSLGNKAANNLLLALNEVNGSLNSGNSLNLIIGDLNLELLLQRHDELNGIQRIGTEVVHETGTVFEVTIGVQLGLDEFTNTLFNAFGHLEGGGAGGHRSGGDEGGGTGHKGGKNKGLHLQKKKERGQIFCS